MYESHYQCSGKHSKLYNNQEITQLREFHLKSLGKILYFYSPLFYFPPGGTIVGLEVEAAWFPITYIKPEEIKQNLFANFCEHLF